MQPGDVQRVMNFLKDSVGFEEAYQVTIFTGFRQLADSDEMKLVTIQILDAGADAGHPRYQVSVQDEDGRSAHGEPAESLDRLLQGVHWHHLDEDVSDEEDEEEDYEEDVRH